MATTPYSVDLDSVDCSNICDDEGNKTNARKANKDSKKCKKQPNDGNGTCQNSNDNIAKPPCKFKKLKNDKLVLEMDCMHYPTNAYPYFTMKCQKGKGGLSYDWPTRGSQSRNDTKMYYDKFMMRIKKNDPPFVRKDIERLQKILNPNGYEVHTPKFDLWSKVKETGNIYIFSDKKIAKDIINRIEKLNTTLYDGSDKTFKINMHHLRPAWALGEDIPNNFWPSLSRHQKIRNKAELKNDSTIGRRYNVVSIHDWWNVKLQDAFENFFKNGNEEYRRYLKQECIPPKEKSVGDKKKKKMKPSSRDKNNRSNTHVPKIFRNQNKVNTYGENNISTINQYMKALSPLIKVVVRMKCKKTCKNRRY